MQEAENETGSRTHYWLEVLLSAGMFFFRGVAAPPSRKLTETPELPPRLLEARLPSKYGSRLTAVPLTSPGARIPGTEIPTLGMVSEKIRVSDLLHKVSCHACTYSYR